MSNRYYGVLTDDGIGDIVQGVDWKKNEDGKFLIMEDGSEVEVYNVFTCKDLEVLD